MCVCVGTQLVVLAAACLQRDYLAAWLALCKPLAAPGQAPVSHPSAASTWQAVAADAVKVARAVLQKYNGHVIGVRCLLLQLQLTAAAALYQALQAPWQQNLGCRGCTVSICQHAIDRACSISSAVVSSES